MGRRWKISRIGWARIGLWSVILLLSGYLLFVPWDAEPDGAALTKKLYSHVKDADRIVMVSSFIDGDYPDIEIANAAAVKSFIRSIEVADNQDWGVCMCVTYYNFNLYKGNELFAILDMPTNDRLLWRKSKWPGHEVVLTAESTKALNGWFAEHAPSVDMGW